MKALQPNPNPARHARQGVVGEPGYILAQLSPAQKDADASQTGLKPRRVVRLAAVPLTENVNQVSPLREFSSAQRVRTRIAHGGYVAVAQGMTKKTSGKASRRS